MKLFFLLCLYTTISAIASSPPKNIPPEYLSDFTMKGKVPVLNEYFDSTVKIGEPITYTTEQIDCLIRGITNGDSWSYGPTVDLPLLEGMKKHIDSIKNKKVAILGSTTPFYESMVLMLGGFPTTIDYNKPISLDTRIDTLHVEELKQSQMKFDAAISISSFEHDGLGRYGDPINPWGDLEAMRNTKEILKDDGILFLAVPIGKDSLVWNAHRIYGELRLPLLLKEYSIIDTFGLQKELILNNPLFDVSHQPIFVLKQKVKKVDIENTSKIINLNNNNIISSFQESNPIHPSAYQAFNGFHAFNGSSRMASFVKYVSKGLSIINAFETGTFHASTTNFLANCFEKVHTIEIEPNLVAQAHQSLSIYPHVTCNLGSSKDSLESILNIYKQEPAFLYLDAHWGDYFPLRDELIQIASTHPDNCVIMIDDFKVPGRPDILYDQYPQGECSYEYIADLLPTIFSDYEVVYIIPENIAFRAKCVIMPKTWYNHLKLEKFLQHTFLE